MFKLLISLFGGYSIHFFLSTVKNVDVFPWYVPLILSGFIFFLMTKFSKGKLLNLILSISTAIPISYLLINFIPESIKLSFNAGFYDFSKVDVITILLSIIIFILPKMKNKWIQVVAKSGLLAASILTLMVNLSVNYIPDDNGYYIYLGIPVLLPIIYHSLLGKIRFIRSIFMGVASYISTAATAIYITAQSSNANIMFEGNYLGFQIMDYLIPVTFLVTLLLGFNPVKKRRKRGRTGYGGGGASYSSNYGGYGNNHSDDGSDSTFVPSYDDSDSDSSGGFFGGGGNDNGDDHNNWGLPQWAIDKRNDEEFYGQPDWYREKEIEEREYGLPWYARSDNDDD